MKPIDKVLYTARTHTVGGRGGTSRSSDGRLDVRLSLPGGPGEGTNPEQLFAAGWSACFMGAMERAAHSAGIALPADASVDAEVDLGLAAGDFQLQARLAIALPGVDPDDAMTVVRNAHAICPYSKATAGNVDVTLSLA